MGRLANLLLFAALAALAVKTAPFGKRVFTVAALLPMTLHLAASFSRDAPLLGLCFVFTALLMDAAFGPNQKKVLSPARLTALLARDKSRYLFSAGASPYLTVKLKKGEDPFSSAQSVVEALTPEEEWGLSEDRKL